MTIPGLECIRVDSVTPYVLPPAIVADNYKYKETILPMALLINSDDAANVQPPLQLRVDAVQEGNMQIYQGATPCSDSVFSAMHGSAF